MTAVRPTRRTALISALALAGATPLLASCSSEPEHRTLDTKLSYVPFSAAGKGRPVIEVFSDFRCPYCAEFEKINAADLARLARDEKIELRWAQRPMLDISRGEGVTFSRDSANAFYACWEQGDDIAWAFSKQMFELQADSIDDPDPDLKQIQTIAKGAGADEKTLDQIAKGAFNDWIMKTVEPAAQKLEIGTPTVFKDGKLLDVDTTSPGVLEKAIMAK